MRATALRGTGPARSGRSPAPRGRRRGNCIHLPRRKWTDRRGLVTLNQLTSDSAGTTYDYDDAGRLIEKVNGSQTTTLEYDLLDELTEVDDGTTAVGYAYDALGRRASRAVGSTTTESHYGDLTDRPILETGASGTVESYVQGPLGLVEERSGGTTAYPLADAHGDITTTTNGSGAISTRQSWDPWGTQLSGPAVENGWLGAQQRVADPTTGALQMGIRSYEPSLGAFLSEDPILAHLGFGVTSNRYAYGWNDPIGLYDLDGRKVCDLVKHGPGIGGALGLGCEGAEEVAEALGDAINDRSAQFAKSETCETYSFGLHPGLGGKLGFTWDAGGPGVEIGLGGGLGFGGTHSETSGDCGGLGLEQSGCVGVPGSGSVLEDMRHEEDVTCVGGEITQDFTVEVALP